MTELDLFAAAVATPDPAARAALLDRACAADPALRERLEKRLAAHFATHPVFEPATAGVAEASVTHSAGDRTHSRPSPREAIGTVIAGRYKLLQQIGEGGMGTVWMAEQTEPVRRKVAVKLIRAERGNSATILARFEAERQAIALMDHPHIAKLLDAGGEGGAPFFVMELVRGVPLTAFCDQHRLSVPDRLALFTRICSAVQHAHQKGVIHRDLKPSNILVESHDGTPVPKVIDFGLAKATSGLRLTEHTLFTGFGSVMGTPAYMAPEQATFNAVDVDTRADVYALGVILYELLTGTTPLTREAIKKAQLDEMLRLVREQEAPTPSSRLWSSESKPTVAANRRTEPAKLGRFLKGELDWIVLKALSKDRERRYETATGFARDIDRFLNHEPVAAGPPSASYRLRKFARRHRGPVLAGSLVLAALLLGIAGTTYGLVRAEERRVDADQAREREKERADGEAKEKEQKEEQRRRADANAAKANAMVADYFTLVSENKLLKSPLPGLQPLRRELLEAALDYYKRFVAEQTGDPAMRVELARAHHRLGRILSDIGTVTEAESAQRSSLAVWADVLKQLPDDSGYRREAARARLALVRVLTIKPDLAADGEELVRAAEKTFADAVAADAADADARRGLAEAYRAAGSWYLKTGRQDAEGEYDRRAYAEWEKLAAADPKHAADLAGAALNLGFYYTRRGDAAEALRYHDRAREVLARLVAENPTDPVVRQELSRAYTNIGYVNSSVVGDHTRAAAAFGAAVRELDPLVRDHPAVVTFRWARGARLSHLAKAFIDAHQHEQAFPPLRRAIADLGEAFRLDPNDRLVLSDLGLAYANLGRLEAETGKTADGIAALKTAADYLERLVAANPQMLDDRSGLARAHRLAGILRREVGDLAGSRESLERALAVLEDPVVAGRTKSLDFLSQMVVATRELAVTLRQVGDLPAAEKACGRLDALWTQELGRDPHGQFMARLLAHAFCDYGSILRAAGKPDQARLRLEDAMRLTTGIRSMPVLELVALARANAQLSTLPEAGKIGPPADARPRADAAMRLLSQTVKAGLPDALQTLKSDDLAPLRGREDFRKLLAELEAKSPPKRELLPPPRADK